MSILIIAYVGNNSEKYHADAAVLPNGRILVAPDAMSDMAETLDRHVEMYRKMISDETGKPATGDELLNGIAGRWNNMAVVSQVFGDDEADEAKKFVKISRMKNA